MDEGPDRTTATRSRRLGGLERRRESIVCRECKQMVEPKWPRRLFANLGGIGPLLLGCEKGGAEDAGAARRRDRGDQRRIGPGCHASQYYGVVDLQEIADP